MKKWISIFLVFFILFQGCQSNDSYVGLVYIHGNEYIAQEEVDKSDIKVGKKVGKIHTKINEEEVPEHEYSSNMLDKGTKLFEIQHESRVAAQINENRYRIFEKRES